jgi:hypothetical protein
MTAIDAPKRRRLRREIWTFVTTIASPFLARPAIWIAAGLIVASQALPRTVVKAQ